MLMDWMLQFLLHRIVLCMLKPLIIRGEFDDMLQFLLHRIVLCMRVRRNGSEDALHSVTVPASSHNALHRCGLQSFHMYASQVTVLASLHNAPRPISRPATSSSVTWLQFLLHCIMLCIDSADYCSRVGVYVVTVLASSHVALHLQ